MRMTATDLRQNLYRVLDRVAETGEPVEIERNGRVLRIAVETQPPATFAFDQLEGTPIACITGDPDDLAHVDWSGEWSPDGGRAS